MKHPGLPVAPSNSKGMWTQVGQRGAIGHGMGGASTALLLNYQPQVNFSALFFLSRALLSKPICSLGTCG